MAMDVEVGPLIAVGNAIYPTDTNGLPIAVEEIDIEAGPNLGYQGDGFIDPRFFVQKDYAAGRQGSITSHLNSPYVLSCDQIPAASAATPVNVAGAQTVASGVAMTLAAASVGISTTVPFIPFKTGVVQNANIALDFGFLAAAASAGADTCTVTTTNGNQLTASSLLAASNFYPGQWVIIPNGASATTTYIGYVVSVVGTTITLSANLGIASTTIVMVGSANIPNVSWPPAASGGPQPASAAFPYLAGGVGGFMNPKESLLRGLAINAAASATGGIIQLQGWDIYGQPQTENITTVAATTVYGNKTWKFVQACVPQFTDAGHNYSVGTSDLFGFVVRSDRWEYTNIFWNGAFVASAVSASGAWLGGDLTTPATTTTKDVRGVFQPSARGPLATAAGSAANGSIRLALLMSLPLYNVIAATPANPTPLYGTKPV
jgi:hypothetical protein